MVSGYPRNIQYIHIQVIDLNIHEQINKYMISLSICRLTVARVIEELWKSVMKRRRRRRGRRKIGKKMKKQRRRGGRVKERGRDGRDLVFHLTSPATPTNIIIVRYIFAFSFYLV